ncbi:MAG: alkaline phosphatase family protein [Bacteroidota bacterium]
MRVVMLFLDGVGLGEENAATNPFFVADVPTLRLLSGGRIPSLLHTSSSTQDATLLPLDATLGVEGFPQSGTGQTALFTGINASKMIGKHFGPYPYSSLRPVVTEKNIFKLLLQDNKRPYFVNAFPQRYFDYMEKRKAHMSVTTLSWLSCDRKLNDVDDLRAGRGISADITNHGWPRLGYPDIEPIAAAEAGKRLALLSEQNDFVLFEYWQTDKAGHAQDMAESVRVIERFDGLLAGLVRQIDMQETLIVITSDHGNMEDLGTRSHTRNPVPLLLCGYRHAEVGLEITGAGNPDLTRVTPALLKFITSKVL